MTGEPIPSIPLEQRPRWERVLMWVLALPSAVLLLVMMLYIVANALSRRMLNHPLPNTLELTQYWFMPVLGTIGFVAAELAKQHVDADLFWGKFPPLGRKWLTIVIDIVLIVVVLAFAWFGLQEALHVTERNVHAGYTDIPAWPVYYLIPLSFLGYAILLAVEIKRALLRSTESFNTDEEVEAAAALIARERELLEQQEAGR